MTTPRISLRPATPEDADFLRNLFAADKAAEFAVQGFPEAVYQPLIDMQYRGRAATYFAHHPNAESWIICLDERPAGNYLLDKSEGLPGARIIDLAVLPPDRNHGLATQVLQQLQQQAAAEGSSLRLRVEKQNPALRLYTRLGFKTIDEDELSFEMLWQQGNT
jgi:ribosomal protein S18 acetylase RimI-like enzyme